MLVLLIGLTVGTVAAMNQAHNTPKAAGGQANLRPSATATLDPAAVTWQDYGGAAVPRGAAGPHNTQAGRALGFDHSPAGAVLAAINLSYRAGAAAGSSVFEPTIAQQVVGPDQPAMAASVRAQYLKSGPQSAGQAAQIRASKSATWGYRVDAYSADAASVSVLLRSVPAAGPVTFVNLALSVQWRDGDWRLVAPPRGEWASVSRVSPDVPAGHTVLAPRGG